MLIYQYITIHLSCVDKQHNRSIVTSAKPLDSLLHGLGSISPSPFHSSHPTLFSWLFLLPCWALSLPPPLFSDLLLMGVPGSVLSLFIFSLFPPLMIPFSLMALNATHIPRSHRFVSLGQAALLNSPSNIWLLTCYFHCHVSQSPQA